MTPAMFDTVAAIKKGALAGEEEMIAAFQDSPAAAQAVKELSHAMSWLNRRVNGCPVFPEL